MQKYRFTSVDKFMRHRMTKKHMYAENENLNLIQYDELKLYK